MAKSSKKRVRGLWLQIHKWIGLTLAILIIPISLTGSVLVWHEWLDSKIEPQRFAQLGPALLPPSAYAEAAAKSLRPGEQLSELRFNTSGRPIVAMALKPGEGRPQRTSIWLDPRNAAIIDRSAGNGGVLQIMHVLHGSLLVPGWGRTVVGWVGAFMFVSCLTGIWLWWPLSGGVGSGFRWKRRNTFNANLHYMTGFWVLLPLAMLSFTGTWISFPKLFGQFETRPPMVNDRERAARAQPLIKPATSVDAAVATAKSMATGPLVGIAWPTDQNADWKISFDRKGGAAVVTVDDGSAAATPAPPPKPETLARKMRRWHDGTDMGPIWNLVISLAGIIPAILSVSGIVIWWRARAPRQRARDNRRLAQAA